MEAMIQLSPCLHNTNWRLLEGCGWYYYASVLPRFSLFSVMISQDDFKQNQYKPVVRVTASVFTVHFLFFCVKFIWSLHPAYHTGTIYRFSTSGDRLSQHAYHAKSYIHISLSFVLKVWFHTILWPLNAPCCLKTFCSVPHLATALQL